MEESAQCSAVKLMLMLKGSEAELNGVGEVEVKRRELGTLTFMNLIILRSWMHTQSERYNLAARIVSIISQSSK